MRTARHVSIDTLNAYCRPVLVTGLPLCQGRLYNIHEDFPLLSGKLLASRLSCSPLGETCFRLLGFPTRVGQRWSLGGLEAR